MTVSDLLEQPCNKSDNFVCAGVMYSGEYDVCDVTLSVHPHRASWKVSFAMVGIEPATIVEFTDIEGTRLSSEISSTRTDLTT
jgi:hypothetical protein